MIARKEAELLARRAVLRERIRTQRQLLAQAAHPLAQACARVDRMHALSSAVFGQVRLFATRHPAWIAAALAVLIALRPRRLWRWGGRLFWLWQALRPIRIWLGPLLAQGHARNSSVP
ncbi:YqjK family protein [Thiobacter aerophilum]|uniref:YqjK family protein n=1 Tax=Thiobacter aerophilum TaxID=3121275 RepID=A0ABV0EB59_9BURK